MNSFVAPSSSFSSFFFLLYRREFNAAQVEGGFFIYARYYATAYL